MPGAWLQMSQGAEEARASRLHKIQGHDVQGGDATPDLPAGAVLEEARRGGPQSRAAQSRAPAGGGVSPNSADRVRLRL